MLLGAWLLAIGLDAVGAKMDEMKGKEPAASRQPGAEAKPMKMSYFGTFYPFGLYNSYRGLRND